ncbi:nucleolar protein 14 [Protomyces lactucae-debilis]|uniref:Nucleolar protein 14 n=1 Tax=Protomyces lactucae-debilis TaxID=2754530 RepID=A0A1Y2ERK6_PROLT|nr:nucleolar protein 14 [Protomyces lactucae-debilis]ORY73914.1 nucleolar protein 14 [Protomyces lactucae-debilis]
MPKDSQSQLKRLKTALRESGISRAGPKSKSKQGQPQKTRADRQKALDGIRERFNPYEQQVNKTKFAVGGRRLKGDVGRPGQSASVAERMREETLGAQRAMRGRVGGVLDRRFGEGRADLTPEQIQLERYTRERQKSKKRPGFSLEDEEDGLTHLGQSLSTMDDFGPAPLSDDEDMGAEVVARTNFGGFDEQLEEDEIMGDDGQKRKKTKAEVMQEIIAKSKAGKYERQKQADEDADEREALDAELEDLQMLLADSQQKKPKQADGVNPERLKAIQEDTEYDKAVRELIFDRRAKASDRTKTEEELIEEEAKALHEKEEARIKRMHDELNDEDDVEASDDEGEDAGIDVEMAGSEIDEDETDGSGSEASEDEDEDEYELPSDALVAAAQAELARRAKLAMAVINDASKLKFTYPCPSTMAQLLEILDPLSEQDKQTAIHRIRVLHHPRLNPSNGEKLAKFLVLLVDYLLLPSTDRPLIDYCTIQVHDLASKYWEPATLHFLSIIESLRQRTYTTLSSKIWSTEDLKLYSLIGSVWSVSDAYHKVATPALLLASQYLSQNAVASDHAQQVKLSLCSILLSWVSFSKRLLPEVIYVLQQTLQRYLDDAAETPARLTLGSKASKATLYQSAAELSMRYAQLYTSLPGFPELFAGICANNGALLAGHPTARTALLKAITNVKQIRRPLALQQHRAVPIAQLAPKFSDGFSLDRKSTLDRDDPRQQDAKLKAELRDARRGAVRVLRRDAAFEARQQAKEKKSKSKQYTAKMGKIENRLRDATY